MRAPVQADGGADYVRSGEGTIDWAEHEEAWRNYARRHGHGQSAKRIAESGGFGYHELMGLLGRNPSTWTARRPSAPHTDGKGEHDRR